MLTPGPPLTFQEAELMSGEKKSMADYRDNVVIVVNVASF